jgi:hypothetical protein
MIRFIFLLGIPNHVYKKLFVDTINQSRALQTNPAYAYSLGSQIMWNQYS